MAYTIGVNFFNSFWLKKIQGPTTDLPAAPIFGILPEQVRTGDWPGLPWNPFGYPEFPFGGAPLPVQATLIGANGLQNFYIEETRIRGGFNNSQVALGVRAYVVNTNVDSLSREHSLIHSGLLNTRTGFNETNVFSIAEAIVTELDPLDGSIQHIYAEDTNLTIFQENKINKILINKNSIYSGDQGSAETTNINVFGQAVPYLGEYGISRNPESFAVFGYRKYFADRNRAAILRLSRDGITEISGYGMKDFFRDELGKISDNYERVAFASGNIDQTLQSQGDSLFVNFDNSVAEKAEIGAQVEVVDFNGVVLNTQRTIIELTSDKIVKLSGVFDFGTTGGGTPTSLYQSANFVTFRKPKVLGAYDAYTSSYTMSLQTSTRTASTADDTFETLSFDETILGWTSRFTYKPDEMGSLKNNFFTFIDHDLYQHYFQDASNSNRCKFYGATVPADCFVQFILNPNPTIVKNFNTIAYEGSNGWEVESYVSDLEGFDFNSTQVPTFNQYQDQTSGVKSYIEGQYDSAGNVGLAATVQPIQRAGFSRKENHYVANLINNSSTRPGQVIGGIKMSGVKGYLMVVKMKVDTSTQVGGAKELFSASSGYVVSSM